MRVTTVDFFTTPPFPAAVMLKVPVVAVELTLIVIFEDPVPGAAIVDGLKVTCTPAGTPIALRSIDELKPPEAVVVILTCPL